MATMHQNTPDSTNGSRILMPVAGTPAASMKAAISPADVSTALPMAKPLPVAAVVFITSRHLCCRAPQLSSRMDHFRLDGHRRPFPQFRLRYQRQGHMHQLLG